MSRSFALTMLLLGCTPASPPAPAPTAVPTPSAAPTPSAVASAPSAVASTTTPAPDAVRDKRIHDKFGTMCRLERTCGVLWGIDCDAAVDGPYYYVKAETLEKVSDCGGFCQGGRCTNCPPKQWTCATY
jgi:hypothetical protein